MARSRASFRAAALRELPPDPPGPAARLQVLRAQAEAALEAAVAARPAPPAKERFPKEPLFAPNGAQIFASSASFVRLPKDNFDSNRVPPWAAPALPYQPGEGVVGGAAPPTPPMPDAPRRASNLPPLRQLPSLEPRPPGEKRDKRDARTARKPSVRDDAQRSATAQPALSRRAFAPRDEAPPADRSPRAAASTQPAGRSRRPFAALRGAFRRWEGTTTTFSRADRGLDLEMKGELREFTRVVPGNAPPARTMLDGLKALRGLQEERSHLMTGANISLAKGNERRASFGQDATALNLAAKLQSFAEKHGL